MTEGRGIRHAFIGETGPRVACSFAASLHEVVEEFVELVHVGRGRGLLSEHKGDNDLVAQLELLLAGGHVRVVDL